MNSFADQVLTNSIADHENSTMDIDHHQHEQEEEDPFLRFMDSAKSVLRPDEAESEEVSGGPGWSWIASRILRTCIAYSSGVTSAILLSDLCQAWNEQHRTGAPKKRPECINQLKKKHKRAKLPNTVTIDSIYEKNFLSLSSVLEAVIVDAFLLPGTNIYMLSLGDFWSSNTIELYLHRRFYNLADPNNGILKKGREIFLTGCYLRTASGRSSCPRLLPTEYLVILLDEDQDDDAMLLGAQFCSDSFSSISLDAVNKGVSYSLYARIESIGPLEIQGKNSSLQRKQVNLVDNDGIRLKFPLWGEQVILANLFSVGSMLAMDRPFIASSVDSAIETCEEICLEYGSATQLFLVPFIQHEEQVCVALTQNRYQGSKVLGALDPSQEPKFSQVTLPCDSQGSIDFSNYPFRVCRVWLDQIEYCHVNTRFSHARCGHFVNKTPCGVECQFCQCSCDAEVVRTFHLKITLADESAKVLAWCTGQTATELLQISPDEFYELAEEEQIMYPSSLENERFTVAIVNCGRQDYGLSNSLTQEHDTVIWEVTRALKFSIGPFHHDNDNLKAMEDKKWCYLNTLLSRQANLEASLDSSVKALRELEHKARKCYGEDIHMQSDEFVKMMLVDGCFIIELFLKCFIKGLRRRDDPFFITNERFFRLRCDMILLENQIPFFILQHLFNLVPIPKQCNQSLTELALRFFKKLIPGDIEVDLDKFGQDFNHLLDLVRHCYLPTCAQVQSIGGYQAKQSLHCAVKLEEAGINLKKATESKSLLDIKFNNGVLKIPPLKVHSYTEIVFRNLVALEHSFCDSTKYITSYASLMENLIESEKDVTLLYQQRILTNGLEKREEILGLFKKLHMEVNVKDFCYNGVLEQVNGYRRKKWQLWYQKMKQKCRRNPLAVLVVILFLVVIFTGTLFSALSFSVH
ncbi:hypothetical protein F0562_034912 [Nyssa sinensis]|uniref:Uncharacterized protein n=1 Tax=Nyssa sinensis TaxID=561372 RepID=A0A5J5A8W0_9ASTE|nr:hypothetical protein F0562_034912 [Nyssa sinensis]